MSPAEGRGSLRSDQCKGPCLLIDKAMQNVDMQHQVRSDTQLVVSPPVVIRLLNVS